jgi:hypothetical protein
MHILQVTDMAIINPRIVNEFGFQYIWYYIKQTPADPGSALIVNDAFPVAELRSAITLSRDTKTSFAIT